MPASNHYVVLGMIIIVLVSIASTDADNIECNGATWTTISPSGTATPVAYASTTNVKFLSADGEETIEQVVVYGGITDTANATSTLQVLNIDPLTGHMGWSSPTTSGTIRVPTAYHVSASISNFVWLFGGESVDGTPHDSLQRYDAATVAWTVPTATGTAPSARTAAAASAVELNTGQKLMVIHGGKSVAGTVLSDLFLLDVTDPANPVWTQPGTNGVGPSARYGHSLTWQTGGDVIAGLGGYSATNVLLQDVFFFSVQTSRWSIPQHKYGDAPGPRAEFASSVSKSSLWVIGGFGLFGINKAATNEVYRLDLGFQTWKKIAAIGNGPPSVRGHGATTTAGNTLVFGGLNSSRQVQNGLYVMHGACDPKVHTGSVAGTSAACAVGDINCDPCLALSEPYAIVARAVNLLDSTQKDLTTIYDTLKGAYIGAEELRVLQTAETNFIEQDVQVLMDRIRTLMSLGQDSTSVEQDLKVAESERYEKSKDQSIQMFYANTRVLNNQERVQTTLDRVAAANQALALAKLLFKQSVEITLGVGDHHGCILDSTDHVQCWGLNDNQQSAPPSEPLYTVSCGQRFCCGLRPDRTALCWGSVSFGKTSAPPNVKFSMVTSGGSHACGIEQTTMALNCWGANGFGQADPPAGKYLFVTSGAAHNCAINTGRQVVCWGHNGLGRSGPPNGLNATDISAGYAHTCAITPSNQLVCFGSNADGQSKGPDNLGFRSVSAGFAHTCGISVFDRIYCWGRNTNGEATVPNKKFNFVRAGESFSCGVDIRFQMSCWGDNAYSKSSPPQIRICRAALT